MTKQDRPALILIDIQKGFDDIEYWADTETIQKRKLTQEKF